MQWAELVGPPVLLPISTNFVALVELIKYALLDPLFPPVFAPLMVAVFALDPPETRMLAADACVPPVSVVA
jgi:hypothetical protein